MEAREVVVVSQTVPCALLKKLKAHWNPVPRIEYMAVWITARKPSYRRDSRYKPFDVAGKIDNREEHLCSHVLYELCDWASGGEE